MPHRKLIKHTIQLKSRVVFLIEYAPRSPPARSFMRRLLPLITPGGQCLAAVACRQAGFLVDLGGIWWILVDFCAICMPLETIRNRRTSSQIIEQQCIEFPDSDTQVYCIFEDLRSAWKIKNTLGSSRTKYTKWWTPPTLTQKHKNIHYSGARGGWVRRDGGVRRKKEGGEMCHPRRAGGVCLRRRKGRRAAGVCLKKWKSRSF